MYCFDIFTSCLNQVSDKITKKNLIKAPPLHQPKSFLISKLCGGLAPRIIETFSPKLFWVLLYLLQFQARNLHHLVKNATLKFLGQVINPEEIK